MDVMLFMNAVQNYLFIFVSFVIKFLFLISFLCFVWLYCKINGGFQRTAVRVEDCLVLIYLMIMFYLTSFLQVMEIT